MIAYILTRQPSTGNDFSVVLSMRNKERLLDELELILGEGDWEECPRDGVIIQMTDGETVFAVREISIS